MELVQVRDAREAPMVVGADRNEDKFLLEQIYFPSPFQAYELVKKWTRKVDLFTKQIVFVPICANEH